MKRRKKEKIEIMAAPFRGSENPRCGHFGECGGCLFQDIKYSHQLEIKKMFLNDLFEGAFAVDEVRGFEPYGYRNRMDYVAAFGKRGLRRRGFFKQVIDIEDCPLLQPQMQRAWSQAREITRELEDYDYLKHEGLLRYVVLRGAKFTGEVMCNFVLSRPDSLATAALEKICADSQSVILSEGLADLSFGPVGEVVKKGYITENFDGLKYRIYPNSFFQSNSEAAVVMYKRIAEFARGNLLDLYSGVGSISLFAARGADKVTGVEQVAEAVDAANTNLEANGVSNCSFVCADALDYMKANQNMFDCVIMDPPRSGAHPKVVKAIERMAPSRIIYMSCNPSTFKDDVKLLESYKLEFIEAYDMFPQTPHVETLALLERKKQ